MLIGSICIFRGDDFRLAFSQIGDLRSLISENVHILATTATATREVYDSVVKRLSMRDPAIIGLSPSRDNIKYHVEPFILVKNFCEMFAAKIRTNRTGIPKNINIMSHHCRMFLNVPNTEKHAWQ